MLTYTAILIIACKYHSVAKQINAVLQDGVLLSNRKMRLHRYPYIGFGTLNVVVSLGLIEAIITIKDHTGYWVDVKSLRIFTITWCVVGIIVLTVSFAFSL